MGTGLVIEIPKGKKLQIQSITPSERGTCAMVIRKIKGKPFLILCRVDFLACVKGMDQKNPDEIQVVPFSGTRCRLFLPFLESDFFLGLIFPKETLESLRDHYGFMDDEEDTLRKILMAANKVLRTGVDQNTGILKSL